MNSQLKYILLTFFLLCASTLLAQEEIVLVGQVLDKADLKPLYNASVYFQNTTNGTSTNKEGYFVLRTTNPQSILVVSMLGYKKKQIKIEPGKSKGLEIKLEEESQDLPDLVVFPGENPAIPFMKKVRAAGKTNNPANALNLICLVDEKTSAAFNQLNRKSLNNRIFKDLQKGTLLSSDSNLLLPLFFSIEKYSLQGVEKKSKEYEEKSLVQKENNSLKEWMNSLPYQVNFYENYISIMGKQFISPMANTAASSYTYYFKDSLKTDNQKLYTIQFFPKSKKELAFEGSMQLDSASLAITNINVKLPKGVNLNFISKLAFTQEFRKLNGRWIYDKQNTIVNLQLKQGDKPTASFFIIRQSSYDYTKVDSTESSWGVKNKSLEFEENRFNSAIDSLKNTTIIRTMNAFADALINKHIHAGLIDIGPINRLIAYNEQEGHRYTLGLRTGKKLSKHFTISSFLGWGTLDEKWKYGAEMQFRIPKSTYSLLGVKYIDDMYQTDFNYHDQIRNENYIGNGLGDFSTFLFRNNTITYNNRKLAEFYFNKQWIEGFNTHLSFASCTYFANQLANPNITELQDYNITLDFRFSHKERIIDSYFHRIFLSNHYPVSHLVVSAGKYESNIQSDYYLKLHTSTKQTFLLGNYGKWHYALEAGYVFGQAPYPLLEIINGFENNGMGRYALHPSNGNLFVADSYVNFQTNLVTNGVILNYIPLINKLNLRETIGCRMAYGELQKSNADIIKLPLSMEAMNSPYIQLSAGIANLFRILAVEYIWAFPQIKSPKANWGLQARMYIDF